MVAYREARDGKGKEREMALEEKKSGGRMSGWRKEKKKKEEAYRGAKEGNEKEREKALEQKKSERRPSGSTKGGEEGRESL